MSSRLHSTIALCLLPPHERLTTGTNKGQGTRNFLVQGDPGYGYCFFSTDNFSLRMTKL